MARETIEIEVKPRQSGKSTSRALRRSDLIPAVVYGPKTEPVLASMEIIPFRKLQGKNLESTIFKLKSAEKSLNGLSVIFRDIQVHPVTRIPQHIDFYSIDLTKAIRVSVEIRITGKAEGISEGGLLEQILRELEIEAKADAIPEFIEADVTPLKVGDALHVSDLKVPAGVKVLSLSHLTIATCAIQKEEVVATTTATPEAAAGAAAASAAGAAAGGKADDKKAAAPAKDEKKK
jgi:large subunit ribosomal protein L25